MNNIYNKILFIYQHQYININTRYRETSWYIKIVVLVIKILVAPL